MAVLFLVNFSSVINKNLGIVLLTSFRVAIYADQAALKVFQHLKRLSYHAIWNTTELV